MKTIMKTILLVTVLALILAFGAGCQTQEPVETEHVHNLIHNKAVAATCTVAGVKEHWYCFGCNTRFTDAEATEVIAAIDLAIERLPHTPAEDDGDCTTAVACTVCGKDAIPAKAHTPAEDDGDCTTAVVCTVCGKDAVAAKDAHDFTGVFNANDTQHWHICANDGCEVTDEKVNHEAPDDGDCTTADLCGACGWTVVAAKEAHTYVDGCCSDCGSSDPNYYFPATITEALAKADGAKVSVSGTVSAINTAWSDTHGNISVTITDDSGKTLYLYRLKTNVTLGDIITVKGDMATYNGSRQIAAGATAEITGHDASYDYEEMSIEEALQAADGANVIVTGTVVKIGTAYSSQHGNISVYIADENGTQLYLYRLTGNVTVGQIIKVKGSMATYNGARQVTGGTFEAVGTHECTNFTEATCTHKAACVVCGATTGELADHTYVDGACSVCGAAEGANVTTESLSIAASAGALTSDKLSISWTSTGFTFTINKDTSSNDIRTTDGDHFRAYAGAKAVVAGVDGAKISKVVITCLSGYIPTFADVDGATITVNGTTVTIEFAEAVDSVTLNHTGTKQWRLNNVEATYVK